MRVLLYAKLLKETETEEIIVFFVIFLSLVAFQLEGGGPPVPLLATPMIPGPTLHCREPLALWGFSQHLPAKYR